MRLHCARRRSEQCRCRLRLQRKTQRRADGFEARVLTCLVSVWSIRSGPVDMRSSGLTTSGCVGISLISHKADVTKLSSFCLTRGSPRRMLSEVVQSQVHDPHPAMTTTTGHLDRIMTRLKGREQLQRLQTVLRAVGDEKRAAELRVAPFVRLTALPSQPNSTCFDATTTLKDQILPFNPYNPRMNNNTEEIAQSLLQSSKSG